MLKNAYDLKVPLTFSTDADYWVEGKTRGEVAIEFIETWKAARHSRADILRAMTTNGYKVSETEQARGPIKAGFFADLIAVRRQSAGEHRRTETGAVRDEGRTRLQARRRRDGGGVLQRRPGQRLADSVELL